MTSPRVRMNPSNLRRVASLLGLLGSCSGAAFATSVAPAPVYVVPAPNGTDLRLFFDGRDGLYEFDASSGRELRKVSEEQDQVPMAVNSNQLLFGSRDHSYLKSDKKVLPVGAGYCPESAIIAAQTLVFASRTRGVDGFDPSSGMKKWHLDTSGLEVKVLAAQENVVVTTGMLGTETRLRGLDYRDGSIVWTQDVGTMTGMTVALSPDGSEVIVGAGSSLRRLNSKTGKTLGLVDLGAQIYNTLGMGNAQIIATTRTSTDSHLWILSPSLRVERSVKLENYVQGLCVGAGTVILGLERRHEPVRLAGYAVTDGTLKWRKKSSWSGQTSYCGSPYFYSQGVDGVEARRYEDGQTIWRRYRDGLHTP